MSGVSIVSLDTNSTFFKSLTHFADLDPIEVIQRTFPDGESYLKVNAPKVHEKVWIHLDFSDPNRKILPLIFLSKKLRTMGAKFVGLLSPYLPYMRQDNEFHQGEVQSAHYMAELVCMHFHGLLTVDPHLHRIDNLDELYYIDHQTLSAGECIAHWIDENVHEPYLIGPDEESIQWVQRVAKRLNIDYQILIKERFGDRDVQVSQPKIAIPEGKTPVILDDIVSSGMTMIEAIKQVKPRSQISPVCVSTHGIYAEDAKRRMMAAGAARVVCTNTLETEVADIDITSILHGAVCQWDYSKWLD
ncbi:ribose-phosphate diphosphokinase [Algicola sagamiensis]|uniref:ribose-phosphate diphosphokinase n=1 Tax=Algicola sagamiensis TaxID=163869 RepID=UPI000362A93A|nr:ribose-phosphate diphosphokinase [Algicola sagamiensis]